MASAVVLDVPGVSISSSLPGDWQVQPTGASISTPNKGILLPAGAAYLAHARRILLNRTLAEDIAIEAKAQADRDSASKANGIESDPLGLGIDLGDEEEDEELLSRDPKEWKSQDHYAVLGLSAYRYKATDAQIKVAHRRKVLRHHPDKKAGLAGDANDDAFFKCIQKAMEVLTNPERRRQFDSVDPHYIAMEEAIPSSSTLSKSIANDPAEFFETFAPIFELEARFSIKVPVPMLGEINASKNEVEGFYDFWYNFDSWRSFEYYDKEVNEGSDSRDDKRYTEKKNKSERARRKKEDNTRLRSLVDLALSLDPRIKRIKQEEREARVAKKNQKANGTINLPKQVTEDERKRQEEESKKKEEEEKAARADAKKAKAAAANAAKKARRAQRATEDANGNAS